MAGKHKGIQRADRAAKIAFLLGFSVGLATLIAEEVSVAQTDDSDIGWGAPESLDPEYDPDAFINNSIVRFVFHPKLWAFCLLHGLSLGTLVWIPLRLHYRSMYSTGPAEEDDANQ